VAKGEKTREFQLSWWIGAEPSRVFGSWTDPAELGWFYNDKMPEPDQPIEVDLRVGGVWRQMMIIDNETAYFTGGIYRQIVPDRKLVFAWGAVDGWPQLDPGNLDLSPVVTVTFEPERGGTRLELDILLPEGFSEEMARKRLLGAVQQGWRDTVARLEARFI
jgi:uncharacterized protein YndB with AHSA1/START domain